MKKRPLSSPGRIKVCGDINPNHASSSTLIILSTLFTKQHAVIDAAAGIFVASLFLMAVKAPPMLPGE